MSLGVSVKTEKIRSQVLRWRPWTLVSGTNEEVTPFFCESKGALGKRCFGVIVETHKAAQKSGASGNALFVAVPIPYELVLLQFNHAGNVIFGVDREFQASSGTLEGIKMAGLFGSFSHHRLIHHIVT